MKPDGARQPFEVHCAKCSHEWAICFVPIPAEEFGKLTKGRCPKCGGKSILLGPTPKPTEHGNDDAWVGNGDTGTSSLTIWAVLMRRTSPHGRFDIPYDPDDFGRCVRLLDLMPAWRHRLHEVVEACPRWAPFVREWDALRALYDEEAPSGRAPKLYARMQELRAEVGK